MPDATESLARKSADRAQWFGVLAGPFAWLLQLQIGYSLVQTACNTEREYLLHLVTVGALLLAAAGAFVSWRELRRLPAGSTDEGDPRSTRSRFMALFGLAMSLLFATVVVASDLTVWVLRVCD